MNTVFHVIDGIKREFKVIDGKAKLDALNDGAKLIKIVKPWNDRQPYKAGDIIEINSHDRDGDVRITNGDDDNYIVASREFVILQPTSVIEVDGVKYRESNGTPNVGDKVLIIDEKSHNLRLNSIATVTRIYSTHCEVKGKSRGTGGWSNGETIEQFVSRTYLKLLEPVTTSSIVCTGFNEVKRYAKVGERIKVVATHFANGKYKNGDILVVSEVFGDAGVHATNDGARCALFHCEYVVLEPVPTVQPAHEVKRHAKVGERIKIVDPYMSMGRYNIGDVFTVEADNYYGHAGGVRVSIGSLLVLPREYVVLEEQPKLREFTIDGKLYREITVTEPKRGQLAVVVSVSDRNPCSRINFKVNDLITFNFKLGPNLMRSETVYSFEPVKSSHPYPQRLLESEFVFVELVETSKPSIDVSAVQSRVDALQTELDALKQLLA